MVDEWIASPEFKAMPEGSLVLAPSLFEHYPGTVHVFDGYWNQYVRQHGRKTIEVFRDRTAWHERAALPASADRLFFLELTQPRRDDASYLLFGRVMPIAEGRPMASRELSVLLHARADHFRLVGRLLGVPTTCRARLFVNDIPTQGTFADRFGAHLDAPRQAREWLWARLRSGDAAIDPESILITASEIPVDGSAIVTFGKGFHLDDVEHRWSEETAVATLRNPENRTIRADIEFAVQAPGLPPGSDGRLTATAGAEQAEWRIGRRYETRSMRIEIAPTSTIDVVFGTDVPRVNAPLDSRRLFLRFQPQIRVREVGCEDKE
jgi:hypothetical protein